MFDPTVSTISTRPDHPLSPQGRFNRLSYLGWYGLLSLICMLVLISMVSFFSMLAVQQDTVYTSDFSVFSGVGVLLLISLWCIAIYLQLVFFIRRLHDLNKTGWLSLLLLVPVIQLFFTFYVLLAPGTPQRNDYGDVRPSTTWEKILAWLMIILSILMFLIIFIFFYYFASPAIWNIPAQMMQNSTEYF